MKCVLLLCVVAFAGVCARPGNVRKVPKEAVELVDALKPILRLLDRREALAAVEKQDFGLEDVTGAIKDVTGYIKDISTTIGPALGSIFGKRDVVDEDKDILLIELMNLVQVYNKIVPYLSAAKTRAVPQIDVQNFGLEDITGAIKDITGYIKDISSTIGPALTSITLGKRDAVPIEIQDTDWDKVLDDLKGIGKDIATTFANVGPALVSAFGKREVQDFGLEDITGAIKGVTGVIADIASKVGPALSIISLGRRDVTPIEIQNTDWDKVLDDLKGIGKDIATTFANVGPALVSAFGKRDNLHEIQDFGLEDITGAIKDVTHFISDISKQVGPALGLVALGKRVPVEIPVEFQNTDWDKVLDDIKGIGKDIATTFANVGPALVSAFGKRENQDFGLEDVTGAIKGVTGYLADISKTIGPALNAIGLGKRDVDDIEIQNTDWDKVLDDLKGIGKDLASTFANVGPALVSAFGKRDLSTVPVEFANEFQNTDWNQVLDDLKGIGKDIATTFANVGPALVSAFG